MIFAANQSNKKRSIFYSQCKKPVFLTNHLAWY